MKSIATILVVACSLVSCSKSNDRPSTGTNCDIKDITMRYSNRPSTLVYTLNWNSDHTISKMSAANDGQVIGQWVFSNIGSAVIRTSLSSGNTVDTMWLDANGRIVKYYNPQYSTGISRTEYFDYDASGLLSQWSAYQTNDTILTRYYWQDADVVKTSGVDTNDRGNSYEYYNTHWNTGNARISIEELLVYGRAVSQPNKLVKTMYSANGSVFANFTYTFDASGKITRIVKTNPALAVTATTDISYTCQ